MNFVLLLALLALAAATAVTAMPAASAASNLKAEDGEDDLGGGEVGSQELEEEEPDSLTRARAQRQR